MGNSRSKQAEYAGGDRSDSLELPRMLEMRLAHRRNLMLGAKAAKYAAQNDFSPEAEKFVAEYEFAANGNNQLSLPKGSVVQVIKANSTKEWCEVQVVGTSRRGWVPRSFITPESSLEANDWYHGDVDRATTQFMLSGQPDGTFLVRTGITHPGSWSVSVLFKGKVEHVRIMNDLEGSYFITEEKKFPSLASLVKYYSTTRTSEAGGELLRHPAPKKTKPMVYSLSPTSDDWEVSTLEFRNLTKIGQGNFGIVEKATWAKFNKTVAIKSIKQDLNNVEFTKEASVMKSIRHPNLVQLLGICTSKTPFKLISEFMCEGDLGNYLRKKDEKNITWLILVRIAVQVVMGMEYLEERNFVHRDLAARNCMVGENNTVKVGDFGLSRMLPEGEVYQGGKNCKFPSRWTAPEGVLNQRFTTKSDVWSFGVLLWEICTLGRKVPYDEILTPLIISKLMEGKRLKCPEYCPNQIQEIMKECWEWEAADRPTFAKIRAKFNAINDLLQLKADLKEAMDALETMVLLEILKIAVTRKESS